MSNKKQLKINKEDLSLIYGADFHLFEEKIIPNCYRSKCKTPYQSTITNYEVFLNDLNDIVLKEKCSVCESKINRYLETGEVEEYLPRIRQIRKKYAD